jgi:short-subunit dehydrogenase
MEIALITGASSGIGWETAKLLASKGYRVYGTTRSRASCPDSSSTAKTSFGDQFQLLEMDVTKAESIKGCVDQIIAKEGKIDILVCNAGFGLCGSIEEMPDDLTQKQFAVNVFGLLRTVKAVLPHMRSRNSGRIILVSSVSSSMVIPYQAHYSATKYAVDAFTEGLRHELYGTGIKVSAVRPGHMRTNFLKNAVIVKPADSPYNRWFSIALESINNNISTAPLPVITAKKIYAVLRKRWPKTYYSSGALFERLAPLFVHLIPSAIKEKFIRRFYRIDFK